MDQAQPRPPTIYAPDTETPRRLRALLGRDWAVAYLFLAPTALLMGGLIAYPFLRALYISFTNTRSMTIGPWVGLANYRGLWEDRFFRDAVWVTIRFTVFAVGGKLLIALLAALLLHRLGPRAGWLTGILLLPWIMPQVVRAITWRGLLDPLYGGLNHLLKGLGLIRESWAFFGDPRTALASVILVNIWQGAPFFLINLLAGLKAIDREYYEAAAIDGAGRWRQFLHITLPGIRYVLLVTTLLSTIWTFNDFEMIFLLTGGGPMNLTKVYSVLAYQYAVSGRRFGPGTAVAMSMAPVFVLAILTLGRQLLGAPRDDALRPPDGPVARLLRALAWPFHMALSGAVRLFWAANDAIEGFVARLGRLLARLVGPSAAHRLRRRRRAWFRISRVPSLVALFLLLAFELGPFYWVLVTAFKSELQIGRFISPLWLEPWTLFQFERLLGPQRSFLLWLQNTMLLSTTTPLISTLTAALGAYALARLRWRGAQALSAAVLASYLMPAALMIIPLYQLFVRLGLTNTRAALILTYPTLTLPFALWLLTGYYASIPEELEAAALVDGCSRFQTFWRIILPLSKPALVAVALFGITQAWSEFLFAATFILSESKRTIPLGLAGMIWADVQPWGELSAAALLMAIPVLALYALGQRFMVAGLTAGALKGG